MTTRRSFSPEYKLEAVRAAERSGNVAQTARDLDIRAGLIYRWKRELRDDGPRAEGADAGMVEDGLTVGVVRVKELEEAADVGVRRPY